TSRLSKAVRRAFTTTTTNAMQNVMCAAITVLMLKSMWAKRRKNAVREMAITISGMTRETKISVEYTERPLNLKRVRAKAARVPRTVATSVGATATLIVFRNACSASWLCTSLVYQRVEKPVQV